MSKRRMCVIIKPKIEYFYFSSFPRVEKNACKRETSTTKCVYPVSFKNLKNHSPKQIAGTVDLLFNRERDLRYFFRKSCKKRVRKIAMLDIYFI